MADSTPPTPPAAAPQKPVELTLGDVYAAVFTGCDSGAKDEQQKHRGKIVSRYLQEIAGKYSVSKDYNIVVLFDDTRMVKGDADNIYNAVNEFADKKPLLLVLRSTGGDPAAAYLIGKLCRDYCAKKFVVVVPRQAKSAATLLSCAADEIHMGSLSELGPIDPQIDGLPALGLKHSVEHIAELVKTYPASSEMFAKFLSESLKLIHLGYYERVAESAMHYAERLLKTHPKTISSAPEKIAQNLVYGYKDHSFVIDKDEAIGIFSSATVKVGTEEYLLGNHLYQALTSITSAADWVDHNFYFIGSLKHTGTFTRRSK